MRPRGAWLVVALLVSGAGVLFGQYTYDFTDPLTTHVAANWLQPESGGGAISFTPNGLGSNGASSGYYDGGALIWSNASLGAYHEVKIKLKLVGPVGTFISYLRASPDALSGSAAATGSFYSTELSTGVYGGQCPAQLVVNKVLSGVVTTLGVVSVPCHDGTEIRSVYTAAAGIVVYVDNVVYFQLADANPIASGQPGAGIRWTPASTIQSVSFGHLDTIAPNVIPASSIGVSTSAYNLLAQWPAVSDDPNGTGVLNYHVWRNGA